MQDHNPPATQEAPPSRNGREQILTIGCLSLTGGGGALILGTASSSLFLQILGGIVCVSGIITCCGTCFEPRCDEPYVPIPAGPRAGQ